MSKKEASKNLKFTVQILGPLDSAVSPSRHAVSPSRLAVSSRCLAVSPSRQRNDLDISKFEKIYTYTSDVFLTMSEFW